MLINLYSVHRRARNISVACLIRGNVAMMAGVFALALYPAATEAADSPRERLSFNADWRFQKDDPGMQVTSSLTQRLKTGWWQPAPGASKRTIQRMQVTSSLMRRSRIGWWRPAPTF